MTTPEEIAKHLEARRKEVRGHLEELRLRTYKLNLVSNKLDRAREQYDTREPDYALATQCELDAIIKARELGVYLAPSPHIEDKLQEATRLRGSFQSLADGLVHLRDLLMDGQLSPARYVVTAEQRQQDEEDIILWPEVNSGEDTQ